MVNLFCIFSISTLVSMVVKKKDPKLEQKLKDIEFKKKNMIANKLYKKLTLINKKYESIEKEFWEKIRIKADNEYLKYKKRAERQVENWSKNQIRKAKGSQTIKYATKEKSIAKIKSEYLTTLQKYVRLRDSRSDGYWECISCLATVHWKKANWWHYITRANNATCFDLRWLNLQCVKCNGFKGWNPIEYRKNLIKKIWLEEVESLEKMKYEIVALDRDWMIEQTKIYKVKCEILESQKT